MALSVCATGNTSEWLGLALWRGKEGYQQSETWKIIAWDGSISVDTWRDAAVLLGNRLTGRFLTFLTRTWFWWTPVKAWGISTECGSSDQVQNDAPML